MVKFKGIPQIFWKILLTVVVTGFLSGCILNILPPGAINPATPTPAITSTPFQPKIQTIFFSKTVPQSWVDEIRTKTNLQVIDNPISANLTLSLTNSDENGNEYAGFTRVYAAVVKFPTVNDNVSMEELKGLWQGVKGKDFDQLLVSEESSNILQELWGSNPSEIVSVMDSGELLDAAWSSPTSIAMIPFEELSPRWKVLKINGISPLDKPMKVNEYPLTFIYNLIGQNNDNDSIKTYTEKVAEVIPATNRDESLMTVVVMSGTTALVRATAYKIEKRGTEYPISDVKDWFLNADIRHVSNEISINQDCPEPNPLSSALQFCTKEEYLPVLQGLGINVVELTGNHLNDYGSEKLADTIGIYNQIGMSYFGGGLNLEDAQKPLKMTVNGNKVAFIGCNYAGPTSDFATETRAGSAPCDMEDYAFQIKQLKNEGYTVFATFQYSELYVYMYDEAYQTVFHDAANAGANVVQGSQAHFPMGFELIGNSLIHYGLGNFLFDQMDYPVLGTRREFVDRHVIYNGKYINTELLTAYLTDWSKPVPMTEEQRFQFLTDIFTASKMR
jgi:hypothetical protein